MGSGSGFGRDADDIAADVYDFVADFLDDQGSGNVRRIGDYIRRYPQAEEEVALEYLRLVGLASGDGVTQVGDLADGSGEVPCGDGERRVGRYRLERLLGRGGQGEVWLAEDEQLQRRVALKLLTATFVTEERRGRFRREAESIARLEHPGLAAVHDADIDGDPPHIAMRFVQGVDLGASFGQREAYRASGSGVDALLPWVPARRADLAPVLRFFERAARALHAAHSAGVLHRDVKPGNIMVTEEGEPVLLDFGLAREEEAEGGSELTREGDVFGTLAYMAPEQLRGDLSSLDGRVDVWALGVTLYEALTGRRPFEGASPGELAVAIDRSKAPDARSLNPVLPQDVRVVLETALEPDPERRYSTALELAEDLRRICEFEPIQARPAGPVLRLRRWARREPAWAAALAVTLVALVAGLIASQTALKRITTLLDLANGRLALANAREYTLKVPALGEKAPAAALALGLEAVELEDSWTTRSSLFGPLMELTLQGQIHLPQARAWGVGFDGDDVVFGCGNSGGLQRADLRIAHDDPGRSRSATLDADVRALAVDRARGAVVVGTTIGRVSAHDRVTLTELWSRELGDGSVLDLQIGATHGAALLRPRSEPGSPAIPDRIISFDLATGDVHATLDAPEGGIDALRGGNGEALFVATGRAFHGAPQTLSTEAVVLELPDLREVVRIAHGAPLRAAEIAADARLVATLDAEGSVQVTSLESGFPVRLTGSGGPVESGGASLAFSRDGTRLALGLDVVGRDAHLVDALRVWTLNAGAGADAMTLDARETWTWPGGGRVVDLAFSPDGEKLAVASRNGVYVFDGGTGSTLAEHRENNKPLHLEWSPSGKYLASIGIARTIEVWRTVPTERAFRCEPLGGGDADEPLPGMVWGSFTSDGERVVLLDDAGRATLVSAADPSTASSSEGRVPGARIARLDGLERAEPLERAPLGGALEPRARMAVARDVERAVWVGHDGLALFLDTTDGRRITEARIGDPELGVCRSVDIAPDGRAVVAVDAAGEAWEWAPPSAPLRLTVKMSGPGVTVVRAGRNAFFLGGGEGSVERRAYGGAGDRLRMSAPLSGTGERLRSSVGDLAVSPNGGLLHAVVGRYDLRTWDVQTGRERPEAGLPFLRRWVGVFDDGRVLSVATGDNSSQVLDLEGGFEQQKVSHDADITCHDLDEAAGIFVTGSLDGTVFVWNARTCSPRCRSALHEGPVHAVAMDLRGEGGRVLSCGPDGAMVWPIDILSEARRMNPRDLLEYERRQLGMSSEDDPN